MKKFKPILRIAAIAEYYVSSQKLEANYEIYTRILLIENEQSHSEQNQSALPMVKLAYRNYRQSTPILLRHQG